MESCRQCSNFSVPDKTYTALVSGLRKCLDERIIILGRDAKLERRAGICLWVMVIQMELARPNGVMAAPVMSIAKSSGVTKSEWGSNTGIGLSRTTNTGNYSGCTWRCLPIRNTTSSSITRDISVTRTGSGGSYGGHGTILYTPSSGKYSAVTSGTWAVVNSASSTSESHYNITGVSITIPANTTVLLMNVSGWYYRTTYWFKDSNMFYNLQAFFTEDNSLVCDLRMLDAMATIRIEGETSSSSNPWKLYPQCALKHGDR